MIIRLRSHIFNLLIVLSLFYPATAAAADLRGIAITARDNMIGANREVKLYRQMHAVIIGIDKYPNLSSDQQLAYAVKDAKGVEKVLREQYSFDNIYIHFIMRRLLEMELWNCFWGSYPISMRKMRY